MESVIKLFIKLNNLKQRDIAEYLGITDAAVSNMVNGKSNPSEENLRKLINNESGWDATPLLPALIGSQNQNSGTIVNSSGDGNFFAGKDTKESELVRQLKEEVEYLRNLVTKLTEK